jgi:hypothetical protein
VALSAVLLKSKVGLACNRNGRWDGVRVGTMLTAFRGSVPRI